MKFAIISLCAFACFESATLAQDLTPKAPPQAGVVVLVNAYIDPITAPVIERGFVEFDKGVITRIGSGDPPASAGESKSVLDVKRARVYPGFVATWTQLGLTEIQAVRQTQDLSELGDVTPEVCPANAVNPDSTLIPVTRSNGVLIAGVAAQGGTFPGALGVIRLDGWTTADMTIERYVGQVCVWPGMRTISAWWMDRSEDDQRRDIASRMESITRVFDNATRYRDSRAGDARASVDLRWEAMIPVLPIGEGETRTFGAKRVFVRADDVEQIGAAVAFAKKRGLQITIVGGREADQCAPLLKENKVPVIVMGTHVLPSRDDSAYDSVYSLPSKLAKAGVKFAITNADDTAHERNLPYAAASAVAHGLDRSAALRAITIDAAEILGISSSYGSLDVGKSATMIIAGGDPLEAMTSITGAYIDGRVIDLSNKQTELAEKYREKYRQSGELRRDRGL